MSRQVKKIAVIGQGYVGLPLAVAFGARVPTVGFDVDGARVADLQAAHDRNGEVSEEALRGAKALTFSADPAAIVDADFYVVAVPTPVDKANAPDLTHLLDASRAVGRAIAASGIRSPMPIVCYESTVYPGCTEERCVPVLEEASGLALGQGFELGYSPERISPGDPDHTIDKVVKIVAGRTPETLATVADTYRLVVVAGVYEATDIRTAEAAKIIENVQRDHNIALMNELSMLFNKMGINSRDVLAAARTKWNFLEFTPGLVGGHCIPVDPYYLAHKAMEVGYHPDTILVGRRINDQMGAYVAKEAIRLVINAGKKAFGSTVLVLGASFKENVGDVRNTLVVDLVQELESFGAKVGVYEPLVDNERLSALGLKPVDDPYADGHPCYDMVILAVPHRQLRARPLSDHVALLDADDGPGVLIDIKGVFAEAAASEPRIVYWTL